MKHLILFLAPFAAYQLHGATDLVAGWDFNNSINSTTTDIYRPNYGPQKTTAGLYVDGSFGSSNLLEPGSFPNFGERNISGTGYTTNLSFLTANSADGFSAFSTTNNKNLSLFANNTSSTINGKSVVFAFSTVGFEDIFVRTDALRGANGPNLQTWAWSTDGSNYTTIAASGSAPTGSSAAIDIDLTGITAVDNQPSVYLRLTLNGQIAGPATGNFFNLDNFQVGSQNVMVPEPSTWAAIAGLGVLGIALVRRRSKRS